MLRIPLVCGLLVTLSAVGVSAAEPSSDLPGHESPYDAPGDTLDRWTSKKMRKADDMNVLPVPRPVQRLVRPGSVLTRGGDRNGYATVVRPYTDKVKSRIAGKLFFHDPRTGRHTFCSASVIRSRSRTLVATAAHCTYNNRGHYWYDDLMFVPASHSGSATKDTPYGRWPVLRSWIAPGWEQGNAASDFALLVTGPNAMGRRIQEVVGGYAPRMSVAGTDFGDFVNLGYPGDRTYSGGDLYRCRGRVDFNNRFYTSADRPIQTGNCHAYGGNSGGPWIVPTGPSNSYEIIGVLTQSTDYDDPQGISLAARFASTTYGKIVGPADDYGMYADAWVTGRASAARRGKRFTYRVTAGNNGPLRTEADVIRIALTGRKSRFTVKGPGCRKWRATATCRIPALAPGGRRTFTVTAVLAKRRQTVQASTTITSRTPDRFRRNNKASLTRRIR